MRSSPAIFTGIGLQISTWLAGWRGWPPTPLQRQLTACTASAAEINAPAAISESLRADFIRAPSADRGRSDRSGRVALTRYFLRHLLRQRARNEIGPPPGANGTTILVTSAENSAARAERKKWCCDSKCGEGPLRLASQRVGRRATNQRDELASFELIGLHSRQPSHCRISNWRIARSPASQHSTVFGDSAQASFRWGM